MKKLFLAALALVAFTATSAQQVNINNDPYIEVRGYAKKMIDPNKAEISITLNQADSKGKLSMQELEDQLAKAMKAAGIDVKSQLVLTNQSSEAQKRNKAFQFKSYTLTISTAAEADNVFAALAENNVNNASLIRVWNDQRGVLEQELKSQAIINAQNTAKILTGALGQTIGKAIQITDYSHSDNDLLYIKAYARNASSASMDKVAEPLPNIEFQQIKIEQNLNVRFELK